MAIDIEAPGVDEAALVAALQELAGVKTTRVSVSSAEILDLHNTPKVLVPAPGAGKMIQLVDAVSFYTFGASWYISDDNLIIINAGTDGTYFTSGIALGSLGDQTTLFVRVHRAWASEEVDNQPVVLEALAAVRVTGNVGNTSVGDGGSGYDVDDTGGIAAGSSDATYIVTAVDGGGAVTAFTITAPGTGYEVGDGQVTQVSTGAGDGAFTIDIDSITSPSTGTLLIELLYRSVDRP